MDALLELSEVGGEAGGKARGLARLDALGLPVPPALVLPVHVYARWRETGELPHAALAAALERLEPPLAVRSSASEEDTAGRSAAGQYESVMGVRTPAELAAAIERCYRAAESERARAYRGESEAELALVLQEEVAADRAGVGFSVDPLANGTGQVLLEAVFGHGEQLVAGKVDPDRYWVSRNGRDVRARLAEKRVVPAARRHARTLRDDEAREVADAVLRAEKGFGAPVDVEWCFEGRKLWVVQCRPITTIHGRD
jgi:phosphoenolpyruvate synthase/pyruvate phosphate dikinase